MPLTFACCTYSMSIGPIAPEQETIIQPRTGEKPVVREEPPKQVYETKRSILRSRQIIWYVLGVVEFLLLFRFLLKLFGANPLSGFMVLVDVLSTPLTIFFSGLFPSSIAGNIVVEWSTLFAMLVYFILAWGISKLFRFKKPVDPQEVEVKVS